MKLVDNIVQDIESAFEPIRSGNLDEQDFEIEIPSYKDNDNLWFSLNSELKSRGISYDILDTYEVGGKTVYYVMLKRLWKPEYYNEYTEKEIKLFIKEELPKNERSVVMKLTINEGNVLGMGGGYPDVYLPKAAKEYLKRKGFQEVNTEIGPCFYMQFTGNDYWEIYIDEQYGGIYVVQEGYELRPTDDIATIDDYDYKDDIDSVINLGNCLSNGEDFDSCLKAFFN